MNNGLQLPRDFDALLSRARAMLAARGGTPAVILVAGGSCTGKTTMLADPLAAALGNQAWHLSQDMQQCCAPESMAPRYLRDDPAHYGIAACAHVIQSHRQARSFTWPDYDFAQGRHGPVRLLDPRPVLILEGLYALAPDLCGQADLRLYVEAPAVVRLVRRLFRNRHERYPDRPLESRAVLRFLTSVQTAHREQVRMQREHADLCLTTVLDFAATRERFSLQPLAVTGGRLRWQAAFDAQTRVCLERLGAQSQALRIYQGRHCYLDLALDTEAARALSTVDAGAC